MKRLFILILVGGLVWSIVSWCMRPAKPVTVTIPEGASATMVAAILDQADVISSRTLFLVLCNITGNARKLQSGSYDIRPRSTIFSVIAMLSKGKRPAVKIVIPEGFTVRQIADRLSAAGIIEYERFLSIAQGGEMEGYLFPDTYSFNKGSREEDVIDTMRGQFDRKVTPAMHERAQVLRLSVKEIVTLASIVEKEAALSEEKPHIAGVFYNRLRRRMPLESCATVLYALGVHKRALDAADLAVESDYNTYRRYGLPPGPICNPGLDSIEAALYPASTEDLFFKTRDSKTHVFSQTYEEHINR